jgi:glycosyltransferase involved in cell wall biosynthesis
MIKRSQCKSGLKIRVNQRWFLILRLFWDCHGWKLGEYLALGKAIISTPISNDLPLSLVHGENIHIVENNFEEIRKAIILIIKDDEYRHKLEKGAHLYWEKYGTPSKSLELLGL